jgi:hypothetical protein
VVFGLFGIVGVWCLGWLELWVCGVWVVWNYGCVVSELFELFRTVDMWHKNELFGLFGIVEVRCHNYLGRLELWVCGVRMRGLFYVVEVWGLFGVMEVWGLYCVVIFEQVKEMFDVDGMIRVRVMLLIY